MDESCADISESLHVTTMFVTLLTPVDVVTVCPHHGPTTQPGLQLPVVDEEPLVGLGLAGQGPLQLVNTVNCIQDLLLV